MIFNISETRTFEDFHAITHIRLDDFLSDPYTREYHKNGRLKVVNSRLNLMLEGEWENNVFIRNKKFILTQYNKDNNKKNGHGVILTPNFYAEQYFIDDYHSKTLPIFTINKTSIYAGYLDTFDLFNLRGHFKGTNGTYEGTYLLGMRYGFGTLQKINNLDNFTVINSYVGGWKCDTKTGKGEETDNHGGSYKGEFYSNQRHGKGKGVFVSLTNNKKYILEGTWNYDLLVIDNNATLNGNPLPSKLSDIPTFIASLLLIPGINIPKKNETLEENILKTKNGLKNKYQNKYESGQLNQTQYDKAMEWIPRLNIEIMDKLLKKNVEILKKISKTLSTLSASFPSAAILNIVNPSAVVNHNVEALVPKPKEDQLKIKLTPKEEEEEEEEEKEKEKEKEKEEEEYAPDLPPLINLLEYERVGGFLRKKMPNKKVVNGIEIEVDKDGFAIDLPPLVNLLDYHRVGNTLKKNEKQMVYLKIYKEHAEKVRLYYQTLLDQEKETQQKKE